MLSNDCFFKKFDMFGLFMGSWTLVKFLPYIATIKEKMHCMEDRALKKCIIKQKGVVFLYSE